MADLSGAIGAVLFVMSFGIIYLFFLLLFLILNKKYSVKGIKEIILFILIGVLSVSISTAIHNFLWDVVRISNSASFFSLLAYPILFFLSRKLFLKENKLHLGKYLLIILIILFVLFALWYVAETIL